MSDLADMLETEARRRRHAARFMPAGRAKEQELRLVDLLDNASLRLVAPEVPVRAGRRREAVA